MSSNNFNRYSVSCTEAANAMYSSSHVDNATVGCFLDFHEIKEPSGLGIKQ